MSSSAPRRSTGLPTFVALALLFSWLVAWPLAFSSRGWLPWRLHPALHLLIAAGPALAALVALRVQGQSLRGFLRGALRARPRRWVLVGVLAPPIVYLLAALVATLGRAAGMAPPATAHAWPSPALLVMGVAYTLTFGLGEELGWRGFALPRLEATLGRLGATFALYGILLVWHLPLMVDLDAIGKGGAWGLARATLGLLAGAFLLNALYHRAGGNVLPVALFHGFLNGTSSTVDDPLTSNLATLLRLGAALAAFLADPGATRDERGAKASAPPA